MASLLNEVEKNNLTPLIEDLFDTFARDIVVHKEPRKIIKNSIDKNLLGYQSISTQNIDYIPENKTFKAKIKYQTEQDLKNIPNLGYDISKGVVKIKVRKDARDYIFNGAKTEKIEIDGLFFNIITDEAVKKFFNTTYYVFFVQRTK